MENIVEHLDKSNIKPYFQDDDFALYLGDSLVLLKKFPPESFDMIFSDPPYLLSNGGFTVHAGKRVSVNKGGWDKSNGLEEDFSFQREWIRFCRTLLKPSGTIWISGTYHSIYQCGFALQLEGYQILNEISWYKPNASPNLSGRYFAASHETLIWARKSEEVKHYFNYKLMRQSDWKGDFLKKLGKQMRSVWAITTPKPDEKLFGKHPTQKPEALLKRIVLATTRQGDVILDPFTGSSTTGIAAHRLERKFIGIDNERNYLELSKKRYEHLKQNLNSRLSLKFEQN